MKRKLKNIGFLFAYSWCKCKAMFFTSSLMNIFSAVLPLIDIAGLGIVVKALTTGSDKNNIIRIILIYLGINLGISIVRPVINLLNNIIMRKSSDISQFDYISDCVFINYHYVQDGSILNLKKKSMGAQPAWFIDQICGLLVYIVQFAGIIYIFAYLSPWFIIILALTSTVSILLNFKKQKLDFNFQNAQTDDNRKLDYLYRTMSDYKYAKDIRVSQADEFISGKYESILKVQIKKLCAFAWKTLSANLIITVMTVFQTALIYAYLSYQVVHSQIGIAEYTVLLGAVTIFSARLLGVFEALGKINKTLDYAELFREYRDKVRENSNIELSEYKNAPEIDWTKIEIEFSAVSFSYPGSDRLIIDNINFIIKPGEKIGIVGLNGSGKTTLIKLLLRIYDPTSGVITVNGVDIKTIPHGEYVRRIGIVLQDFCLFAYPVKENIVFDCGFDSDRMDDAIRKSGLMKKIESLKNGSDTVIYKELDENGVEFSGGEGQKLALARAVYKNAGMFILDEPTSTLDPIAEYELFNSLSEISGGKTTLFISHRLSSTKFCDRILVLSEGHIAECGSHEELMSKSGIYAELFKSQAKYFEKGSGGV